jgi:hypothetical protein
MPVSWQSDDPFAASRLASGHLIASRGRRALWAAELAQSRHEQHCRSSLAQDHGNCGRTPGRYRKWISAVLATFT